MSRITIRVPAPLVGYTAGKDEVALEARTVREAIEGLDVRLRGSLCDERGRVRPFINLFVNEEHVRELAGLDSALVDGDILHIIPSVQGGC